MERDPITKWILGFVGGLVVLALAPKATRFLLRHLVIPTVGEVIKLGVPILTAGLFAEKAVDAVKREHEGGHW